MFGFKSFVAWWFLLLDCSGMIMHRLSSSGGVSAFASLSFAPRRVHHASSRITTPLFLGHSNRDGSLWKVRGGQQERFHHSQKPLTALQQAAASATFAFSEATLEEIATDALDGGIMDDSLVMNNFADSVDYWDTSNFTEFRVVFVLGGPGAGKGTQSALLEEDDFPVVHLSVGELLREEQSKESSPHRALIEECLVGGKIVPVEISIALLQQAMQEAAEKRSESLLFLVDGFPRNFDNLEGWVRCMKGVSSVWGALVYKCPLDELERRILKRAETSGRSDDNIESAKKRFKTFEQETMPVVEVLKQVQALQEKGQDKKPSLQVMEVKGDQSIEDVWHETKTVMNKLVAHDVWTSNAQLLRAVQQDDVDLYFTFVSPDMWSGNENDKKQVMETNEGSKLQDLKISNPQIKHITGTKVITSYDRIMGDEVVRESRVWSHKGSHGWVNVHFSRSPVL